MALPTYIQKKLGQIKSGIESFTNPLPAPINVIKNIPASKITPRVERAIQQTQPLIDAAEKAQQVQHVPFGLQPIQTQSLANIPDTSVTGQFLNEFPRLLRNVRTTVPQFEAPKFNLPQIQSIGNPYLKTAAQFGQGVLNVPGTIASAGANIPISYAKGALAVLTDFQDLASGRNVKPQKLLADSAEILSARLTQSLFSGFGGKVPETIIKRALKNAIDWGKYGTQEGFLSALQANEKNPTVQQQIIQSIIPALKNGVQSAVAGIVVGEAGYRWNAKGRPLGNSIKNVGETPLHPTLRGLSESVQNSPNISQNTKNIVQPNLYTSKPNVDLMGEAKALLESGAKIDFKHTKNLDQKVAATIQEAINLDKAGNHQAAANLFNNLSEQATELGRGVQAFSLLPNMSPEAIALSVAGRIKRYNATAIRQIPELTGEQMKAISDKISVIDSLAGKEKGIAVGELNNMIDKFIPSSIADKFITVWKAGLLTSLRTHERNLLGNTIMQASEIAKDPIASVADSIMSLRTGERTVGATVRGSIAGGGKGLTSAKDVIKYGIDPHELDKFDYKKVNFGDGKIAKALQKYTDTVFNSLAAEDRPFWHSAFARSLYDQAIAKAKNVGEGKAYIENLVKNPTTKMIEIANTDANYATFHDKNILTNLASALKRAAQNPNNALNRKLKVGRLGQLASSAGKLATEIPLPFTGVPGSIAGKIVAYSPIGLMKGIAKSGAVLAGKVPELQRQAAQEVGRGVLGSGLIGLGAYLAQQGLITGNPKDDKEKKQWKLENKPSNSIFINGKWRNIGSIGPQTLIALAGAKLNQADNFGSYISQVAKDQLSQTFLAGVQQPLNAITDPNRYGSSYVGNLASSFIPNAIKDVSKAFDSTARQYNSAVDYVKSGIPGVRNSMLPKQNVFGQNSNQEPSGLGAFLDLFNSKTPQGSAVISELRRLNDAGYNATPADLTKNQTIKGKKLELNPEQLTQLNSISGPQIEKAIAQLIQTPGYKRLDDQAKQKAIEDTVSDIRKKVRGTADISGSAPKPTYTSSKDSPKNIFSTALLYGKGLFIDPSGTVKAFTTGQPLRKITGNAAIVERQNSLNKTGDSNLVVDHIIPLSIGGTNDESNLQVQTKEIAAKKDVLEKQLYEKLASGEISKKEAQQIMKEFNDSQAKGTPFSQMDVTSPKPDTKSEMQYTVINPDTGSVSTIDLSKVLNMPASNEVEKAKRDNAMWALITKIQKSDLTDNQKIQAFGQLGADPVDVQYYSMATQPVNVRLASMHEVVQAGGVSELAQYRRNVNGRRVLTSTIITQLKNEGLITAANAKYLNSVIDVSKPEGSNTKTTTSKSSKTSTTKKSTSTTKKGKVKLKASAKSTSTSKKLKSRITGKAVGKPNFSSRGSVSTPKLQTYKYTTQKSFKPVQVRIRKAEKRKPRVKLATVEQLTRQLTQ